MQLCSRKAREGPGRRDGAFEAACAPGRWERRTVMICSKCNATIPDGSTSCPECHAKFERHIGSFAGSVHWEDEVRVNESEKRKAHDHPVQRAAGADCCLLDFTPDRRARRDHGRSGLVVHPHLLPGRPVCECHPDAVRKNRIDESGGALCPLRGAARRFLRLEAAYWCGAGRLCSQDAE